MAKKRIINRGKKPIRNAHLIGKGGKQITPLDGSWVGGYNQTMGKPKAPPTKNQAKTALKATTSLTKTHSAAFKKTIQTVQKAAPVRSKGLHKMKQQIAKSAPSPKITMKSRTPVKRRPPTRSR